MRVASSSTFALVLAAAFAGCIATPTPAADPTQPSFASPWELIECRFFNVDITVPGAALEARLPEGFSLDADPSPLAPVTGGAPYLGLEAFSCADGTAWASTYTSVVPPEALARPDNLHFVMWDTLLTNESVAGPMRARGFPVGPGSVTFSDVPTSRVVIDMTDVGAITFTGAPAREGTPFAGDFVEYMENDAGVLAAWSTHYEAVTLSSGRALIDLPAGSWLAEVVGRDQAHGSYIAGTWSFTGGDVTVLGP